MIVTLLKQDRIFSMNLPKKIKGRYWICDADWEGNARNLISVEGINDKWILKETRKCKILNDIGKDMNLKTDVFYKLHIRDKEKDEEAFLFAENANETRQIFKKLVVKDNTEITIGRNEDNVISVNNNFISSYHLKLNYCNQIWTVEDQNSTNGTYVNDYRVSTKELTPADIVFVMGFKIIIGSNFIAINNPDYCVSYDENVLFEFVNQKIKRDTYDKNDEDEIDFFYRSPRFKREIVSSEIKIDPPPQAEKADTVPLALMLGPAITMGMGSMSTGLFTIINTVNSGGSMMTAAPTLTMSFSMLLGMILWPILTKKYEKKTKCKLERLRQAKYKEYLFSIEDRIFKDIKEQGEILFENNVSVDECISRIVNRSEKLWERVIGQVDFLELRVGLGNIPFYGEIQYPEKHFSLEIDNLQDDLHALMNEPKKLNMVPITYSFEKNNISGIISDNNKLLEKFVTCMLLKMISLHSYDELKIVFLVSGNDDIWKAFRWIPHSWNNEKNFRFFAETLEEAKELSVYLEKIFHERSTEKNNNTQYSPYYLIVNLNKDICENIDIYNMVLKSEKRLGFGVINVENTINDLPKECSMVINIDERISNIYDKNDTSGNIVEFVADLEYNYDLLAVTQYISNVKLNILNQRFSLPSMLTFLEMFEVNKIEHLNPLMRWKDNNPTVSLAAPIGVDTMGQLFTLDLHERFQGPHGLVAGMTGSGKSEFIITYILSMAVNYHPDEVAFILIDYKGGGLTGAFDDKEKGIKLPHIAGTITNLDGSSVKRSLISIQSELRRRQAIFNEARRISNEGTMDIYKYQKLYRDKIVSEPVPHLFIISDEFAELKSQQPEFMQQLISAARIGRSLGVHLILATQKPSGVVDDQIWSNSRFRVCLKVQEKADSNDMIKRPDAAELSNTGRFYLQVGFNEFFALGQSAWCGAPYYEEEIEDNTDNSIKVIDNLGRVIREVKPEKKNIENKVKTKQIVALVKYLSDLAEEENVSVRPLWLDPIPAKIYPKELADKYEYEKKSEYMLEPVIGEIDDPFNQCQNLMTLSITESGNTLIYGAAGSGKLTFLTTMLYELIRNYSPEYLNIYIMDFGAETLKMYEKAPQVGGVVLSSEAERIINLMKMLRSEINERKKIFVDFGGDYVSYIRNSGKKYPNIVVVINNYSAFSEMYDECDDVVAYVSREGTKYGIYFVVTATNTGSVRFRIVQNFKQIFVMQMNDKTDYSAILGPTDGTYPSAIKGRGILKTEYAYEFQTAVVADEDNISDEVKEMCASSCDIYKGIHAKYIPILPKKVDIEYLDEYATSLNKVPIGVDKKKLDIIYHNVSDNYLSFVLGQDMEAVSPALQGIAEIVSHINSAKTVVIDAAKKFITDESSKYEFHNGEFENTVVDIFNEMVRRHKAFKETNTIEGDRIVYIINSIDALKEALSEDGKDKLNVLMEKGRLDLRINFIIGDTSACINKYTFDAWYKKHCNNISGIWIGDGSAEQYILKITKPTNELYKEMPNLFGLYISKGRFTLIKAICTHLLEVEEE